MANPEEPNKKKISLPGSAVIIMDLETTLSALLVKNDMSFHWDIELRHWWLVKEKPTGQQKWQSKFFYAPNLELAKKSAFLYLKSFSKDTAPLK